MEIQKNARRKNESFWDTIHNEKLAQDTKLHHEKIENRKKMLMDTKNHNVLVMSEKKNKINTEGLKQKIDDASEMKKQVNIYN